jgi:hypothetical protein
MPRLFLIRGVVELFMVYVSEIQPVNLDMIIITGNQTLVKHPGQLGDVSDLMSGEEKGVPP